MTNRLKRTLIRFALCLMVLFFCASSVYAFGPSRRPSPAKRISSAIHTNVRQALKPTLAIRSRYAKPMTSLSVNQKGNLLATASKNGRVQIWNLENGQREQDISTQGTHAPCLTFVEIKNTPHLVFGDTNGMLVLWDIQNNRETARVKGHNGEVYILEKAGDRILSVGKDNVVRIWNTDLSGQVRVFRDIPSLFDAVLSGRGTKLVTAENDGNILFRDIETGNILHSLNTGDPVRAIGISSDEKYLTLGLKNGRVKTLSLPEGKELYEIKAHGKKVTEVFVSSDNTCAATSGEDGKAFVFFLESGKERNRFTGHKGAVNDLCFSRNQKLLITASADKTVRFWDIKENKEVIRLVTMKSCWAAVSPDGYFDGPIYGSDEDSLDAIRWVVGDSNYGIDGFTEKYYSPTLMAAKISGKKTRFAPEQNVRDVSEGFDLPPSVKILRPGDNTRTKDDSVSIFIEAKDEGGGVDEIRLFHNKKAIDAEKIIRKEEVSKDGKKILRIEYQIPLMYGENNFRAVGFSDERIESNPSEVAVVCELQELQKKPNLHVFAVGISEYRNPELNLNYGVVDATGVLEYFKTSYSALFKNFESYILFNREATRTGIMEALEALKDIPKEDTLVIYFAGHGEAIGDTWYFVPHDLERIDREEMYSKKGISSDFLKEMITRLGASKVFVLMDSCKSGAAIEAFDAFENDRAFALLCRATGVHIAAAAGKDQYAGEMDSLGHGVFTYSLLEGLGGKADNAPKDGNITVEEVLGFIQVKMEELVIKMEEIFRDYDVQFKQRPVIKSTGENFPVSSLKG